jgi:hypothetical protein
MGISPMSYLRQIRLARVHDDLHRADAGHITVARTPTGGLPAAVIDHAPQCDHLQYPSAGSAPHNRVTLLGRADRHVAGQRTPLGSALNWTFPATPAT